MRTISTCPNCRQLVTIPEAVATEALVRCPLCGSEYPISAALAAAPPALILVQCDSRPAAAANEVAPARTGAEAPATDVEEGAIDASLFGGLARNAPTQPKNTTPQAILSTGKRARLPRQVGRGAGPLRKLLGIVGGGMLGLILGYYLLNWLGGPQFDFAKIYLPGIRHTYHHGSER